MRSCLRSPMLALLLGLCAFSCAAPSLAAAARPAIDRGRPLEAPLGTVGNGLPSKRPLLSVAVDGNSLVDGADHPVVLHGVDISGTEWECLHGRTFRSPSDDAAIDAISSWQVNAVRIPLNEDCWLGLGGAIEPSETYRSEIEEYVARLHAHGLYATLDLHWNAPGDLEATGQRAMADQDHAPAFWQSVASSFRSDQAVLFDLYNEPRDVDWECWLRGCETGGEQTAGMQELLDAVRSTGATQPVMVGGIDSASRAGAGWLSHHPDDPAHQLVAAVHVYDQSGQSWLDANIGSVAHSFPVVVGEVGETDCSDRDLDAFLPWADSQGVSYVAWAWYVGDCSHYPSLIADYSGTPTAYGVGYRDHLAEIEDAKLVGRRSLFACRRSRGGALRECRRWHFRPRIR